MTGRHPSRHLRVLSMVRDGMSRREIAAVLSISESTVKTDLWFARWVMDAPTTTVAVVEAIRRGDISLEPNGETRTAGRPQTVNGPGR